MNSAWSAKRRQDHRAPTLFLLCLLIAGVASAAGRRVVVTPVAPLTAADRAELADKGLTLERPVAGGKYLGRMQGRVDDPRVTIEPLGHGMKLHRSAIREALKGNAFAEVAVFFHEDVTLDEARAAIRDAGGSSKDVLNVRFQTGRRLVAHLPGHALDKLARDERVLTIAGAGGRKARPHNQQAAALSRAYELRQAPYHLSGQGVVLSMGELAAAQTTHPDFGGRFTAHLPGGNSSDVRHATHVAGTMIGGGNGQSLATGMAPAATLHEFDIEFWQSSKFADLDVHGVVADNNSWGYVLGWDHYDGAYWIWNDLEEYYGAYDVWYTAPLDQLTREKNILVVFSAGNDAETIHLPSPGAHKHQDDSSTVWCYASGGCNAAPCSGPSYCESTPHMSLAPWTTVGDLGSAKNIITAGAVGGQKMLESYSSRGPTRDGRVKPDLVAYGASLLSTVPTNTWARMSGTSMAAPVVTGIAALLTEQWRALFNGANPLPAQLKTVMIATAEDLGNQGPDYSYGFGLVQAQAAADLIRTDGGSGTRIRTASLAQGQTYEVDVTVSGGQNVRVVLGWSDPEVLYFGGQDIVDPALVNNLDLKVVTPQGATSFPYILSPGTPAAVATRGVNDRDNTEVVEIAAAAAGTYRVIVSAKSIASFGAQQFVLVTNAPIVTPLVLTATGAASSVALTWSAPVAGATYAVHRRGAGGSFEVRATGITTTSWTDTSVTANSGYLYRVVATAPGGATTESNVDPAVTISLGSFTGVVALQHVSDLRSACNALRTVAGLDAMQWSSPPSVGSVVLGSHLTELRTAVTGMRTALSLPAVTFSPSTPGVIRTSDFTQLREALK